MSYILKHGITQHHTAAMPKNIFDLNTYTRNTTSRDLCSWLTGWLSVCDSSRLMIRTNWAVTILWYNKLPPSQVTEKCLWNPNSKNSWRDCFLSTECVLCGSDWSTLRSLWHI